MWLGIKTWTFYPQSLGKVRLSEPLSVVPKDGRLVSYNGRHYVTVPYSSPQHVAENQGRVVALDPGIRRFLKTDCGKIGDGDFGKIQRLCVHLDGLIGRMTKAIGLRLKRACHRMRWRIRDLIDELARWLVDNYDVILLPKSTEMVVRGKQVCSHLLTFAHYRAVHKAFETGKLVLDVNEAYTSKTVSWTGEIVKNLGGAKVIRSRIDGQAMDRDINGARGNTPKLHNCLDATCTG